MNGLLASFVVPLLAGASLAWAAPGDSAQALDPKVDVIPGAETTQLISHAIALAVGGSHSCALTTSGGVRCWGGNSFGQIGDGTLVDRPAGVDVFGLTTGIVAITAGDNQTCVLDKAGGVKCWGGNYEGQVGDGTEENRSKPVAVLNLASGIASIAGASMHTCAVTTGGGAKCWGRNDYGQLGNGLYVTSAKPVDVAGLSSGVRGIVGGYTHSCALTVAGGVKCWGTNAYGQLGDGTTNERPTAGDVVGLTSGVTAIAAGEYHNCAALASGGVKCWGRNHRGQLGDGTTTDRPLPGAVSGLASGVAAVDAGAGHSCALLVDGTMKCWGYNGSGQVGDGTTTNRLVPTAVVALPETVASFVSGVEHNCARLATGGVRCWGRNSFGQLGNGSRNYSAMPVGAMLVPAVIVKGGTQGLWWATPPGIESGWGINLAHQRDIVFVTWYTYGADGKPLWLIAELHRALANVYTGPVSTVTGPPFNSEPFDPSRVTETIVGSATLSFPEKNFATFAYDVNGTVQTKQITRQEFGAMPSCEWGVQPDLALATNYQDLWWAAPSGFEAGWGINFTHQGDIIFATWFTYDAAGMPWWLIAELHRTGAGIYAGPVSTVTGPPFDSLPFDPARVVETVIGSATLTFANGNSATYAYTVNGIAQTKSITRQVFDPPGTACN